MADDLQDSLNEGLYYTTVEGFISWIGTNKSGILSNDTPNEYSPEKDRIKEALLFSESFIDGELESGGYSIPIQNSRAKYVLRMWSYFLASHELYTRRGITKEAYYKYSQVMKSLENIKNGLSKLVGETPSSAKEGGLVFGSSFGSPFSSPEDYEGEKVGI